MDTSLVALLVRVVVSLGVVLVVMWGAASVRRPPMEGRPRATAGTDRPQVLTSAVRSPLLKPTFQGRRALAACLLAFFASLGTGALATTAAAEPATDLGPFVAGVKASDPAFEPATTTTAAPDPTTATTRPATTTTRPEATSTTATTAPGRAANATAAAGA